MKFPVRFCIPTLFFYTFSFGQFAVSGSLTGSYGKSENNYNFQEWYGDLNLHGNAWNGWLQLEYSNPPELGRALKGIRKFRFEYIRPQFELQVGDLYQFWGRGLVLNQFDNQPIDSDNSMRGIAVTGRWNRVTTMILGGTKDYWTSTNIVTQFDNRIPNYKTHHSLLGGQVFFSGNQITIGTSILRDIEKHPIPFNQVFLPDTLTVRHLLIGPFVEWAGAQFDISLEVNKKSTYEQNSNQNGAGFYTDFNYYLGRWSLNLAYKNYHFLSLNPDERWDTVNYASGVIPFQQFPTVFHEHSTRLLNRITHQMDPNDELGYQLRISGPLYRQHILSFEFSRASRHNNWLLDSEGIWKKERGPSAIPLRTATANPFSEWLLGLEGETQNNRLQYSIGLAKTKDLYNLVTASETDNQNKTFLLEMVRAVSVPLQATISISGAWSLDLKYEYQHLTKGTWNRVWKNNSVIQDTIFSSFLKPTQVNQFISFGIGLAPRWSVTLLMDLSSTEEYLVVAEKQSAKKQFLESLLDGFIGSNLSWISLEMVFNLTDRNRITLMAGSQRGGILCSNGICRYIQPFQNGIKIGFISLF